MHVCMNECTTPHPGFHACITHCIHEYTTHISWFSWYAWIQDAHTLVFHRCTHEHTTWIHGHMNFGFYAYVHEYMNTWHTHRFVFKHVYSHTCMNARRAHMFFSHNCVHEYTTYTCLRHRWRGHTVWQLQMMIMMMTTSTNPPSPSGYLELQTLLHNDSDVLIKMQYTRSYLCRDPTCLLH